MTSVYEALQSNRDFSGEFSMERSKLVAIITGAISLFLGVVYLAVVQFLDSRTMVPAPIVELLPQLFWH
jgi:hypothetical protein